MFEALFTRRHTIARYRGAPLLDERLRYLRHCAQGGARRVTLCGVAAHQVHSRSRTTGDRRIFRS